MIDIDFESADLHVLSYETAEDAFCAQYEGLTADALDDVTVGMQLGDGSTVERPAAELFEDIRRQGFFVHSNRERAELHVWAGEDVDREALMYAIAYEIGCTADPHNDEQVEEMRANKYGVVAVRADRLARELFARARRHGRVSGESTS